MSERFVKAHPRQPGSLDTSQVIHPRCTPWGGMSSYRDVLQQCTGLCMLLQAYRRPKELISASTQAGTALESQIRRFTKSKPSETWD